MILLLGCLLALTGCSQGPDRERVTDTDRQRLQQMLDEPIIREAEEDVSKQPGTLRADNTLKRGFVSASVFSVFAGEGEPPVRPAQTKQRTADALGVLRDSDWTIASASCTVPEPDDRDNALRWESTAYKHVDGVSYWANLTAAAVPSRLGVVDIALRAPNVDDPKDLFPQRPAGLDAGSTCIEESGISDESVEQGEPVQLEQVGPAARLDQ